MLTIGWVALALPTFVAADEASGEVVECHARAEPGEGFGLPVVLSDPLSTAFMPALTADENRVLLAWQETNRRESRVAYVVAVDGCIGAVRYLEDSIPNPRRPAVAATASGWVLAYEARDTPRPLVRAVRLDREGSVVAGPATISGRGAVASRVRVAAQGDDVVFAWTDVLGHYVARQGPVEEIPASAVGTRLAAAGLINFPRVTIDSDGTIFLAYRDGGPERTDFEIRLVTKKVGEPFSKPINISRSKGLMSDDVDLAVEADGRLRLVWVEQDQQRPETFEVVHATLDRSLERSQPVRFGTLGQVSFKPSVVAGLVAVWQVGTVRAGSLYFADGPGAPKQILHPIIGGMSSLAANEKGDLHLAFVDLADPPRLRYAWRRSTP